MDLITAAKNDDVETVKALFKSTLEKKHQYQYTR